ncbi:glycosyltransferase-like protein [marine actinobacterium PHSC20C1]|nr:glycosyltransferase-like protein [marine actinobacterium PHSC20C1]
MPKPHLLYVAWGYPPARGAGMYRALATANAYAEAGWRVTVLTATRETFASLTGTDELAEQQIHSAITVVRVPFDLSRGETNLSRWTRLRVASPLLWSFLKALAERAAFPEPRYGAWRVPLVSAAREVHRRSPVDLVISTANPNVDFLPGYYLNKSHGIPYVMDYRDTWHLDMYRGSRIGSRSSRSARWERKLIKHSSEVWFVNKPILEWHAKEFPADAAKFHVVTNGFDPEYLQGQVDRISSAAGLTYGYLGTIYGPMPVRETLEGWRQARKLSPILAKSTLEIHGRLGHYSVPNAEILELIESYAGDGVRYMGIVSKTQVAEVYSRFDALLLILGQSTYITSGKVFEYAGTGLPIASLHHPETASTTVLQDYPRWVAAADVSVDSFANAIVELSTMALDSDSNAQDEARESAAQFERLRQLEPRISEWTRQVMSEGGNK